ncbi:cupin domain-containing protein [Cohnella terricola]|uniref:Cupin domain-containing protein n=1 Tax=Cohnella terricola TaxID=1289167 RepID=A0A559JFM4_9BACL|nr:cupin domain-containing protein [Cohnella terricola]TVX98681.1 cupin domain-containing protein [Cohnella terricola]
MNTKNNNINDVLFVTPGLGRKYNMGSMSSVFLADGAETNSRYSVSEWWLDAQSDGPGPHSHDENEELFYVLEGVMTFLVGEEMIEAPKGSFIRIPANIIHDFMNRSKERSGILNIFIPGGFEEMMPKIVQWYEDNLEK